MPRALCVDRVVVSLYTRNVNGWLWLVVALAGCKDNSGTAQKVSPAPAAIKAQDDAPEPPGGPPSCADVGAHLAAALDLPSEVHAQADGADISVSGDTMKTGIKQAIASACRAGAWALEARKCALTWQGNILSQRASLRDACPGTVK